MRKVDFVQGSQEWLTWRQGLLTATDAAMLLGESPYVTPYKGWQRKVGQASEQTETEAMRRGKRDEPIARDWFIKEYGIEMKDCCVESEKYNFIGASLDGLSACGKYILEIKSNGDQYHFGLTSGGLPDFHMMQMQHQFLATDNTAEKGFYVSWNKSGPIVKEVYPDKKWQDEYLPKAEEFWKKVVFFEPPAMTNRDYKDMSSEGSWQSFATQYRNVSEKIKALEEIKESYRKELIKMCGDDSCVGSGIKAIKKISKGRIDYDAAFESYKIEKNSLETFRNDPVTSWTILVDKN